MRPYWCGLGIRPATLQTAKRLSFSSVNGCLPRKNSIRGHTHRAFIFSQMECLLSLSLFLTPSFDSFFTFSPFRPAPFVRLPSVLWQGEMGWTKVRETGPRQWQCHDAFSVVINNTQYRMTNDVDPNSEGFPLTSIAEEKWERVTPSAGR